MTRAAADAATPAELGAELAGTFLLILVGLLREAWAATDPAAAGPDGIAWCWAAGVVVAVYAVRRWSGAHINPAVTVALAARGDLPWRRVLPYTAAQTVGALAAALVVRGLYAQRLDQIDPGHTIRTQAVFSTLPGVGTALWLALLNEALGTALLVAALLWLLDKAQTERMIADLEPLIIGVVVAFLGMTVGALSGWAINPARDLGPRIVTAATGYATAWQDQTGQPYWPVPIVGPLAGGLLVALVWRAVTAYRAPRAVPAGPPVTPPVPPPLPRLTRWAGSRTAPPAAPPAAPPTRTARFDTDPTVPGEQTPPRCHAPVPDRAARTGWPAARVTGPHV